MSIPRLAVSLGLILAVGSCREGVAPHPAAPQPLRFVRWAGGVYPRFIAVGATSSATPAPGGSRTLRASRVLSLNRYTASFWAVRGQSRSVQINYLSATGDTSQPFLNLSATDPASAPGVGAIAVGDSVLLTVTVDTLQIGVSLQPTGLQFGTPAQVQMWYTGANGDFNGDGVVDSVDARIESQLLGLSYREWPTDPWTAIPASHDFTSQSFTALLPHFSEYAISW